MSTPRCILILILPTALVTSTALAQENGDAQPKPTSVVPAPPAIIAIGAGSASSAGMQRGIAAVGRRDWDAAAREFEAIIVNDPGNLPALDFYGFALLMQGQHEKALTILQESLKSQPNNLVTLINLGNAYLTRPAARLDDYDRAVDAFAKAATLAPDSPDAQTGLGTSALRATQYGKAEAAYRALLDLPGRKTTDDPQTHVSLGFALQRQNKLDEAIAALQKGIELKPSQPGAHAMLGAIYLQQGRQAEALIALETSRKQEPDYSALMNLGQIFAAQQRYPSAVEAYSAAAAVAKTSGETAKQSRALHSQSDTLRIQGDDKAAAQLYDQILAENPSDYDALLRLAWLLSEQGETAKAISRFETAASLRPDAPQAWEGLGKTYEVTGNRAKAVLAWRKAASLTADEKQKFTLHQHQGSNLLALRRFNDLRMLASTMQTLRPTSTTPPTLVGLAYQLESETATTASRQQNLMIKALRAFETAVTNDPKNALAYNNIGVLRERRGEVPLALAAYKKALIADPQFTQARQNLARYGKAPTRTPRTGKIGQ